MAKLARFLPSRLMTNPHVPKGNRYDLVRLQSTDKGKNSNRCDFFQRVMADRGSLDDAIVFPLTGC